MLKGYKKLYKPGHPNADRRGSIREHVYVASMSLGRPLTEDEEVHHLDNNPLNNDPQNLIVCRDKKEHKLLHAYQDAHKATGYGHYMKCPYCKEYDDPVNMYVRPSSFQAWHRECASKNKRVVNPKTGPYKYGVKNAERA